MIPNLTWFSIPSSRHDNPLMCCCYSFVMTKLLTVVITSAAFLTVWIDLLIHCSLRKGSPPAPLCHSDESIFNWHFPWNIHVLGKLLAFLQSCILKYSVLCFTACLFRIVELKRSLFFLIIAVISLSSLLFWSHLILQKCSTSCFTQKRRNSF